MNILRYLALAGLMAYGLSLLAMAPEPEDTVEEIQKMSTSDLQDYMKEVLAFAATISNRSDQQDYLKEVNQKLRDAGKLTTASSQPKPKAPLSPQEQKFQKITEAMTAKLNKLLTNKPMNGNDLAYEIQARLVKAAKNIFKVDEAALFTEGHPFMKWNIEVYEPLKKKIIAATPVEEEEPFGSMFTQAEEEFGVAERARAEKAAMDRQKKIREDFKKNIEPYILTDYLNQRINVSQPGQEVNLFNDFAELVKDALKAGSKLASGNKETKNIYQEELMSLIIKVGERLFGEEESAKKLAYQKLLEAVEDAPIFK